MKKINLRELYPEYYDTNVFVDVPDDVLMVIAEETRAEATAQRKKYRHRAHYSLDCDDGIDLAALHQPLNPETILEDSQRRKELLAAIMTLPPKQARRIYARFYLGLDVVEIARKEGVAPANVYASIQYGLSKLRKKIEK